ncbi:hypothetical protein CAOG_02844 [Capsaspora owczarzaki ATCC 30864]|uniref:G-protein coupled receptors family 3 profile domain-containing protein n=1 Tax=Capsaspora owczarzaki (strain ATCC 30864) TaxID=595528 RepID=A0A0D2WN51_CAPO3|nr:hypothetical protein CAOG_02844 [Capsaspora owczarzaki ATCC 30864]KJE91753.1 hypothetical protein CAOG_002844 [Capsaspora owczarzaki ATCC 30864]|eukprot:XP_004348657.1 hypothetical protein CAOG_02844 [Capsaspora owczarzaki ATCC 30864]
MTNTTWLKTDVTHYYNPLEVWVVSMGALLLGAQLCMALLLVVKREWKPFKAKQPAVLMVAAVAAIIAFLGEMHGEFLLPQEGTVMGACYFWKQWVYATFGLGLFATAHLYRFYTRWVVLHILNSRLLSTSRKLDRRVIQLAGAVVIFLPVVLLSIIVTTAGDMGIEPIVMANGELKNVCVTKSKVMVYSINAAMGLYLFALAGWWTYTLRNVRVSFNEYSSARSGLVSSLVCLVVYILIIFSLDNSTYYYRSLKLALNIGITTPIFAAIATGAVLDWLTNPERAESAFEAGMAMTMLTHMPSRTKSSFALNPEVETSTAARKSSGASNSDSARSAPPPADVSDYAAEMEEEEGPNFELDLGVVTVTPSSP